MDDDYVAPDALTGADDARQMTEAEKDQKCRCGHQRAVHAGMDGLGRCVMSRCRNAGSCGQFELLRLR